MVLAASATQEPFGKSTNEFFFHSIVDSFRRRVDINGNNSTHGVRRETCDGRFNGSGQL